MSKDEPVRINNMDIVSETQFLAWTQAGFRRGIKTFKASYGGDIPAIRGYPTAYPSLVTLVLNGQNHFHARCIPLEQAKSNIRNRLEQLDRLEAEHQATLSLEERFHQLLAPKQLTYGIIDPDYARVFTQARVIAWSYGYTCVMYGSFTRDLDLLMVPWTDKAHNNHEQLLKLIAQSCDLRFRDGKENVYESVADFTDKPHGRKSCSLFFPKFGDRRWIDISFMPCLPPQPKEPQ